MATVIATGRIKNPEQLTPEIAEEESAVLAQLAREGVVEAAYIHEGRTTVTLIVVAETAEAAALALAQLPLIQADGMDMEYAVAHTLRTPGWKNR